MTSVLWRCWLGGRKGIRSVKIWVVGCLAWLSVWSEVQTCIWPSWCHCHSLSLAPVKPRLVLPFWYRLTQVVLEKRPLNGCKKMVVLSCILFMYFLWLSSRCKKWSVPVEKVYNKTQREKFAWAIDMADEHYSFWSAQHVMLSYRKLINYRHAAV